MHHFTLTRDTNVLSSNVNNAISNLFKSRGRPQKLNIASNQPTNIREQSKLTLIFFMGVQVRKFQKYIIIVF